MQRMRKKANNRKVIEVQVKGGDGASPARGEGAFHKRKLAAAAAAAVGCGRGPAAGNGQQSRVLERLPRLPQMQRAGALMSLDFVQVNVVELVGDIVVFAVFANSRLVDFGCLWEFAIRLQLTSLIGIVLQNNVRLAVLKVTKTYEDNIALVDPNFFPKFAANVAKSGFAIKTLCLKTTIAQHSQNLGVLLSVFLEDQLAFDLSFIFTAPPILTTFSLVLRHELKKKKLCDK